jgi:hypothetical protein
MGIKYTWNKNNPFHDFLFKAIIIGVDVANKKSRGDIVAAFTYILKNYLENESDVVYLDFDIINDDGYVKVIGNNAISALWLSGIIPNDISSVLKSNTLIIGNREYKYNKKTKQLKYTTTKN